jgi:hypothetical protein
MTGGEKCLAALHAKKEIPATPSAKQQRGRSSVAFALNP